MTPTETRLGKPPEPGSRIPACTVYLVCIDAPGLHMRGDSYTRHYIGAAPNADAGALLDHALIVSPVVRAAAERQLGASIVRVWRDRDREFFDRLRARREGPLICPHCSGADAWGRAK